MGLTTYSTAPVARKTAPNRDAGVFRPSAWKPVCALFQIDSIYIQNPLILENDFEQFRDHRPRHSRPLPHLPIKKPETGPPPIRRIRAYRLRHLSILEGIQDDSMRQL